MRKAAARLSGVTCGGLAEYMKMPVRQFIDLYNEVAETMSEAAKKAKRKH